MTKYILVGVDGSPESLLALHWAVDTAGQRGRPVRVVRGYPSDFGQWPAAAMAGYVPPPMPVDAFQEELDEAVRYARDRLGESAASGLLTVIDPAHAILTEADGAELVVVGSRSRSRMAAAVLGSVATAVASKAPCPVVVVRGVDEPGQDGGASRSGPIVVGTDGSPDSEDALTFGFEEAARSGRSVEVVYCWNPQVDFAETIASTDDLLEGWLVEHLKPYQAKFPTVPVHAAVVEGRPAVRLIELSGKASMVVVGSRGRGGVKGLLLGSVSQSLLLQADAPVAIVRTQEE